MGSERWSRSSHGRSDPGQDGGIVCRESAILGSGAADYPRYRHSDQCPDRQPQARRPPILRGFGSEHGETMTLHLLLKDLANYSMQIAAVIAAGSVAPLLLRVG